MKEVPVFKLSKNCLFGDYIDMHILSLSSIDITHSNKIKIGDQVCADSNIAGSRSHSVCKQGFRPIGFLKHVAELCSIVVKSAFKMYITAWTINRTRTGANNVASACRNARLGHTNGVYSIIGLNVAACHKQVAARDDPSVLCLLNVMANREYPPPPFAWH